MRADYGDEGSDTLGNICRQVDLHVPTLQAARAGQHPSPARRAAGADARRPRSAGWPRPRPARTRSPGIGRSPAIVLDRPFPTFPRGFPPEVIERFEREIGRQTLGNEVASGTEIIERLGDAHVASGKPIVYTSADSVFQIAAHEDVVPVPELYRMCEAAYRIVVDGLGVGRVIARPFVGPSGAYMRTANRHDYAMPSPEPTLLDRLSDAGVPVIADRQDRGPVRGPWHHAQRCPRRQTMPASTPSWRRCARSPTGYLREPGGLRHEVRASKRRAGLRGQPRALRPAAAGDPVAPAPGRPARHHRRPRQRPDHAEHGSLARVRAGAGHLRAACGPGRSRHARRRLPIWARPSPTSLASARLPHGTSFLTSVCL